MPETSMRVVLEQFLVDEATRPQYAKDLAALDDWRQLSDADFLVKVQEFAAKRTDTNPGLTWTIGTTGNEHHLKAARWVEEEIDIDELFSCGLNPAMKVDLDDVHGNVVEFAHKHGHKYPEFRLNETPADELKRVIAVRHSKAGHNGSLEILDGAHRCVAMAVQGVKRVRALVAELK